MVLKKIFSAYQCDGKKGVNLPLEMVVMWMQPRYVGFDLVEPNGSWERPQTSEFLAAEAFLYKRERIPHCRAT